YQTYFPIYFTLLCMRAACGYSFLLCFSEFSTSDLDDEDKFAGCRTEVEVLNDEAMEQKWHTCSANFSKAWSKAEQNLKEPLENYMEKIHSLALYMFTDVVLKPGNKNSEPAERTPKQRATFEPISLYSSLSELNISTGQVRFSTFILGSDEWDFNGNVSCFEIYSCFGANITKYSVLKGNNQVVIPPYEVFTVTDVQKQTSSCEITYKLTSNLNCRPVQGDPASCPKCLAGDGYQHPS
uniref:NAD(P)(+)--arginine ADP-ribosyltransferase n=1 Tax=Xiphophorus couchianus TaxID=32473 RepID=A0A3B5LXT0_9TELE